MKTLEKNQELSLALNQFLKLIYVDFGINKFSSKIKQWYDLTWEEFRKELESHDVRFNDCLIHDWKDFFLKHKAKVLKLIK